jgi:hypothetical protein
MSWLPKPYNWFVHEAVLNLLALLGIDEPTDQQYEQAERVVRLTAGFVRSTTG